MKKMSFNKKSKNICHSINKTWYLGKRLQTQMLSHAMFARKQFQKEHDLIHRHLQDLDGMVFSQNFDHQRVVDILKDLFQMVHSHSQLQMSLSDGAVKRSKDTTISDLIHLHGGIEIIMRILFHPKVNMTKEKSIHSAMRIIQDHQQRINLYSLEILHGICLLVRNAPAVIGSYSCLLEYLFTLMEEQKLFVAASSLLEELLSANRKIVDLSSIGNIGKLIFLVNDQNFPGFCRILSTAVADIDFSEERATLMSQDKEEKERSKEKNTADANQKLLLNHPHFLKRIADLAGKPLTYNLSTSSMSLRQSFASLLRNEDELMNETPTLSSSSNSASEESSVSDLSSISNDSITNNPILQSVMINEIMYKVEMFYVLTLFLSGPKKIEVQTKLCELQLIPKLSDLFDSLGWNNDNARVPRNSNHDVDNCDFTPESALKIQVLRFVHSFCDHNEKRYLLLTENEMQEVKKSYKEDDILPQCFIDKPKTKYLCTGSRGLITKIVDILKITPANNALRFWHSRAIEGFLRGKVTIPDQDFLISRGLAKHLFEHLINSNTKGKEIIQSSFDLLGEVMKFNCKAYQQFNKAITSDEQFDVFFSVMTSSIIDSNMFVRCIVLSHERFVKLQNYDIRNCRLSGLICKWELKIYLMYKLITAISADSLNQENVSCLNTIVVFLIFAHTNGTLSRFLKAFLLEEEAQKHPGLILSNLYDLLLFWRKFYLERTKDCLQLEQSSGISIEHWKNVVNVMLDDDQSSNTSILHYFSPSKLNRKLHSLDFLARDL